MIGIGIDWAEQFHDVAIGTPDTGVISQFRISHRPDGVASLIERVLRMEPDPAEVRVVLETRHGLLVEALVDAGFTVVPVNPDLVARRRGPARKKDDAEDARICCLLALDRHTTLKTLVPHGRIGGEMRAIGRDDERAARDQTRLLNRLRADLQATYPAALAIAKDDLSAPTVLRMLERWPTQAELLAATRDELAGFARAAHHGRPDRFAEQVDAALRTPALAAKEYLARAKAASVRLAAVQLLALHEARRAWERRMSELLADAQTPDGVDSPDWFPGGRTYLSSTRLGPRLPPVPC
ncbi:IS110 family transposase, partial [Microbacterium sp. HSID17254]|uniref:IS110 family transposase n=1 Tax=Microbacterium sp. HSID17254 TaxID=2419509 RepID=UPI000F85F8C3